MSDVMWSLISFFIITIFIVVIFTRQREGESDNSYADRVATIVVCIFCGLFIFAVILVLFLTR